MIHVVTSNFNKENKICNFIDFIDKSIKTKFQIIIVDDGSKDNSRKILKKIKNQNVKIIFNNKNSGKGYSLKKGLKKILKYNNEDIIILIDIDLPYKTKFQKFLKLDNKLKIISRKKMYVNTKISFYSNFRNIIGKLINFLFRFLNLTNQSDTQAGLKAFKAKYLPLIQNTITHNFLFDLELIIIFEKKIGVSKIIHNMIEIENSTIKLSNLNHIKNIFWDLIKILINKKNY